MKLTSILLPALAIMSSIGFGAEPAKLPPPVNTTPATWCRFVPERADDFAWENDLMAFRAYGPAIAKRKGAEGSGVDCWMKKVTYPIVDRWYAWNDKGFSYHKDTGEGCDLYHVGGSRGCGGVGIWKDDKLVVAGPFKEWKVISCEPQKSVFELTYDYDLAGTAVHEVKRISIELGKRLFQAESTFTENGKPASLDIAIGITTHDGKAKVTLNPEQGWMSCWEIIETHGVGTGVAIAPDKVKSMREIKSDVKDASHAILITHTDGTGKVAYDAGQAWDGDGKLILTQKDWENYLAGWKHQ